MLPTDLLYLTFVSTTKLAVQTSVSRAAIHNVFWNVTDTFVSDATKSCYALNKSHWACTIDVDLLDDVSPDDSY